MTESKNHNDCEKLKNILEESNKLNDIELLIEITTSHTFEERKEIKKIYFENYRKDLLEDVKKSSFLNDNFKDLIMGLYTDKYEYDAQQLKKAIEDETDYDTLIEIIGTRPGRMLNKIKNEYKKLSIDLEKVIKDKTSDYFQKLLITLLNSDRRKDKVPNIKECNNICNRLIKGQSKEEIFNIFNEYLGSYSPVELMTISREYHRAQKKLLENFIEDYFSGNILKLIKTILFANICPSEYFGQKIREGLNNLNILNRVIIVRNEIDIPIIKEYYKINNCNHDMGNDIEKKLKNENECYKKLLLKLINRQQ